MPKTLFGNLNSFEIPKVDVITDQHHDTDGELFYSFLVRPCTDKYITYEVSKDGALINKTSNKKQDLLCTLLELPADPSADDIADFISEYGFFLSEFNNNSGRYIRYQEDDIKQIISYVKKLIELHNYYAQLRLNAGRTSEFVPIDYVAACNLLIDIIFTKEFQLSNSDDVSDDSGKSYVFGFNYCKDFYSYVEKCGADAVSAIDEYTGNIYDIEAFSNYIKNMTTNDSVLDGKPYSFLRFMMDNGYLKYYNDISKINNSDKNYYNSYWEIPHIVSINEINESFKKGLMNTIMTILKEQIDQILNHISPRIRINNQAGINVPTLSWEIRDLTCAIFLEILRIQVDNYEFRRCRKLDGKCPNQGTRYILVACGRNNKYCNDRCRVIQNAKNHRKKPT